MPTPLKDRAQRAIIECLHYARFTEEPGRITRRFLTPPVRELHGWLGHRMEALGMTVRTDAIGNLRGIYQPANASPRRLVIGSHIDSVPNAGAFDGVLGVVLGLELVQIAKERELPLSIEVIAFSEEEGVRFGVPFLGSRAVAGSFDPALLERKDADGVTLSEAIRAYGLNPAEIPAAQLDSNAAAFFEIHIEQGPVLESENLQLAVVSAIVGQMRSTLTFTGHANHAGTTPPSLRHDALAAAAEWITAVEAAALRTEGLVATVGQIAVEPNAANVVPGLARLSLDVRHADDAVRTAAVSVLIEEAHAIAQRRKLIVAFEETMSEPAIPMDRQLTAHLTSALQSSGFPLRILPSGAGHDTMMLASHIPSAMLFVRSIGGISHHPDESVREQDVEAALEVAASFLQRIAATIS